MKTCSILNEKHVKGQIYCYPLLEKATTDDNKKLK